ncbi:hypothetical protein KEM55_007047 [Ascosphaera atra]|nr:hypothetical protein KEM55_007047 [Ascosphaera atra]
MSVPSVPRAARSGEPSGAGPPTAADAANPDHRLRHRPLIDERQMWVDTVEDGVTGNHWLANLAYAPLRELLEDMPPPTTQATRGVNEIITSAAQALQDLAPVLRGVGLRLAYADDPSYARDPDQSFEEKLRLMVAWARDMDRMLVDRAWYEDALRYLTGAHLKGVQKQIVADPRVSARRSSDVFDPR